MANTLIDRRFYDAIVNFEGSEAAQDYYYSVMNAEMDRDGKKDTVRNMILRVYSMLFCDDLGALPGQIAGPDDVVATADRLHTGTMGAPSRGRAERRRHAAGRRAGSAPHDAGAA